MKRVTRTYKNWIKAMSVAGIAIFSLLIINNALFNHTHQTESGKLVSHAHPFSKSTHSHSNGEICYYDNLQLLSSQELPNLLPECFLVQEVILCTGNTSAILSESICVPDGRAPPAC